MKKYMQINLKGGKLWKKYDYSFLKSMNVPISFLNMPNAIDAYTVFSKKLNYIILDAK